MSTEEKVSLVSTICEEYGLNKALEVAELPKSSWYYHRKHKISYEDKYSYIRPYLEEIALNHPFYGIPRITEELQINYALNINHKVIQRLLQKWGLSLQQKIRSPKPSAIYKAIRAAGKRVNLVAQMEQKGLFEVVYTDFTELLYANGTRKAYLMSIIGHECKMVFGWQVGHQANTSLALAAWLQAKKTFTRLSIPFQGIIMHHDQDPVYTGYGWVNQLIKDKVRISYTLNGAKDNPEMESFNGRFKTENRSLFLDANNIVELCEIVSNRIDYYNVDRRHSSLNYISPLLYLKQNHLAHLGGF
jgi:putative transposase